MTPQTLPLPPAGVALVMKKHGRLVTIAKLVRVGRETILAMPYRHRAIATPSLPRAAVELARRAGVRRWVVRLDLARRCYELSLDEVERVGTVGVDGEIYVHLKNFRPTPWLDWPYVTDTIVIG